MSSTASNRCEGRKTHAGFTLLELLAVVAILSAVAYIAVDGLEGDTNQRRFDDTRNRISFIRSAIVGDAERTVNGQPIVSGFVADVGRLPDCVRALMEIEGDCDNDTLADANTPTAYAADATSGISSGWRGPYLSTFRELDGDIALRDGWGNEDTANPQNYGWSRFDDSGNDLIVQSLGADLAPNPTDTAPYLAQDIFSRDFPPSPDATPTDPPAPFIEADDYLLDISTVPVVLRNGTASDTPSFDLEVCLTIYYPNGTGGVTAVQSAPFTQTSLVVPAFSEITVNFAFPAAGVQEIPWGIRAMQLFEAPGGICSTTAYNGHTPQLVTVLPRAALPIISWTVN